MYKRQLQRVVAKFDERIKKYVIKINVGKTKVMEINNSENRTVMAGNGKYKLKNAGIWEVC